MALLLEMLSFFAWHESKIHCGFKKCRVNLNTHTKVEMAMEIRGAITVTLWPFHLPFKRYSSSFHLECLKNSHKNWCSIISEDDRPICWMPLSQEKSTNALTNDNTAITKQWILSAQRFRVEMTVFKASVKCTLIVSLNVRCVSCDSETMCGELKQG